MNTKLDLLLLLSFAEFLVYKVNPRTLLILLANGIITRKQKTAGPYRPAVYFKFNYASSPTVPYFSSNSLFSLSSSASSTFLIESFTLFFSESISMI